MGVISAFIVYAKQFSRPINEIAQIYGQLQTAIAGAERVFALLDENSEEKTGKPLVEAETATVTFDNVKFSYVPGYPVLHDFSLTVPAGKKVALVGATGSGKTTVVNLLMRFYDIDSGAIYINRQNIQDISRDSLRKHVAIVLQDTILFSDTIANNLKYGNDQASAEQLDAAVEMSRCKEMIQLLPQGYDTILTGAGQNISQGQRQLLAIARAFVADPQILILDEATSNVDTRTEKSYSGRHAARNERPHQHHHCPSALHHSGRRYDCRYGSRPHRRKRRSSKPAGTEGQVLSTVSDPVCRLRHLSYEAIKP